jgi:hypothetical protein
MKKGRINKIIFGLMLVYMIFAVGVSASSNNIKKFTICHGTDINIWEQDFISNHFDLVESGGVGKGGVENITNTTILCYYDAVALNEGSYGWDYINNSHEDWFVHYDDGTRVKEKDYGWYLMNISSGWSDFYANHCLDILVNYTYYNGIFADDCGRIRDRFDQPLENIDEYIVDNYDSLLVNHIDNLKTILENNTTINDPLILPNEWKRTVICENVTHFTLWECFVHWRGDNATDPGESEFTTRNQIEKLNNRTKSGDIIAVLSGCDDPDWRPDLTERWLNFTLACYLLAVDNFEMGYFGFNFFRDGSNHGYYPIMDYDFGLPTEDYHAVLGTDNHVYIRAFNNATVIANIHESYEYNVNISQDNFYIILI